MKTILFLLFLSALMAGQKKPETDGPSGLMVEFIRNPGQVRILDAKPEFSWIVPDDAESQTAYQILVSSSKELLSKDIGDFWNGLRTVSSKSVEVEYAGGKLSENSTYFWKVRIWSKKGKPSSWSAIQSFKTGSFVKYATTGNIFTETLISPERTNKNRR